MSEVPLDHDLGPPNHTVGHRIRLFSPEAMARSKEVAASGFAATLAFLAAAFAAVGSFIRELARLLDVDTARGAATWVLRILLLCLLTPLYVHLTGSALRYLSPELAVLLRKWIPWLNQFPAMRRADFAMLWAVGVLAASLFFLEKSGRQYWWNCRRPTAKEKLFNAFAGLMMACDIVLFAVGVAGGGFNASPTITVVSMVILPCAYTGFIVACALLIALARGKPEGYDP